jgi:hypothetical protein
MLKPIESPDAPTPTQQQNGNVGSARTQCCFQLSFIHLYGAGVLIMQSSRLMVAGQSQATLAGTSCTTTTLALPYASLGMEQERLRRSETMRGTEASMVLLLTSTLASPCTAHD